MASIPASIAAFLSGRRLAVAGVSRSRTTTGNHVFRKLRSAGYEVIPLNPHAAQVEGVRCYPSPAAVEGPLDGLVIATAPGAALAIVRDAAAAGVPRVWFHRSVGEGSVSDEAVAECRARGLSCIVGGCPLMYCEPVDPVHRCMRWILHWGSRLPR